MKRGSMIALALSAAVVGAVVLTRKPETLASTAELKQEAATLLGAAATATDAGPYERLATELERRSAEEPAALTALATALRAAAVAIRARTPVGQPPVGTPAPTGDVAYDALLQRSFAVPWNDEAAVTALIGELAAASAAQADPAKAAVLRARADEIGARLGARKLLDTQSLTLLYANENAPVYLLDRNAPSSMRQIATQFRSYGDVAAGQRADHLDRVAARVDAEFAKPRLIFEAITPNSIFNAIPSATGGGAALRRLVERDRVWLLGPQQGNWMRVVHPVDAGGLARVEGWVNTQNFRLQSSGP